MSLIETNNLYLYMNLIEDIFNKNSEAEIDAVLNALEDILPNAAPV